MLLLAFDTATAATSVAVHDGTTVVGRGAAEGAMAHGELLAPAIQAALRDAGVRPTDLTDVAVGVGPGPFTGLRVGVVTALTLAETLGLQAHGVCTLDVIAAEAASGSTGEFVVATDARRKEVYWARYGPDGSRRDGPGVDRPATVAALGLPVVGRGARLYADVFGLTEDAAELGPLDPSAGVLADLVAGGRHESLPLEPLYLRRPDAVPQVPAAPPA